MRVVDITGKRFGRLTVIRRTENHKDRIMWLCICDCGNEKVINGVSLRRGLTESCGCLRGELSRDRRKTHGHTLNGGTSREYSTWLSMKWRCTNEKNATWERYGGRGITVCDRWMDSFEAFFEDMGRRPNGMTLDRIDNDEGYFPGNCRWATVKQQNRNKRSNHLVNVGGKEYPLIVVAEMAGKHRDTIRRWIKNGQAYNIERAIRISGRI